MNVKEMFIQAITNCYEELNSNHPDYKEPSRWRNRFDQWWTTWMWAYRNIKYMPIHSGYKKYQKLLSQPAKSYDIGWRYRKPREAGLNGWRIALEVTTEAGDKLRMEPFTGTSYKSTEPLIRLDNLSEVV